MMSSSRARGENHENTWILAKLLEGALNMRIIPANF